MPHPLRPALLVIALAGLALTPLAAESAKLVVFAKTYGDYRPPAPAAAPQTFTLTEGQLETTDRPDDDLARLNFGALAGLLSAELVARGFAPATTPAAADLLIVVHRGRTRPVADDRSPVDSVDRSAVAYQPLPSAPANPLAATSGHLVPTDRAAGLVRPGNLAELARKLGYLDALQSLRNARNHPLQSQRLDEVLDELAQERYYLVLAAYDARARRHPDRPVLRWETRMSFLATGKSFVDRAPPLLAAAAVHFGRNTAAGTLDRRFVRLD